jgi:hypothetical protein
MPAFAGMAGEYMTSTKSAGVDRTVTNSIPRRSAAPIVAPTRDGPELPVIDVTDARFAVPDDPDSLRRLLDLSSQEERRQRRLPRFILRWLIRSATRRSLLMQALFGGDRPFLDGLTTYIMKLGPDNLPPPYDSPMDRRMAASPHLTLLRLRTQQIARLVADGLVGELEANAIAPLHLINIGGGPAIDSMNALIMIGRHDAALLRRRIVIHVLDGDDAGPFFGRNALAALMQDGAPLAGLDIAFDHRPYDWNKPEPLDALVRDLNSAGAIIAASTEGGLFEYGSDDAIIANLERLRAGSVKLIAGSVTSSNDAHRRNISVSRFRLVPRGLEGFAPLAAAAGYGIAQAETAQLSDQVLLRPA